MHRTERIQVRGMPEALSLSRRDIVAYLSLLVDESETNTDEGTDSSDIEEVLRKCHALQ